MAETNTNGESQHQKPPSFLGRSLAFARRLTIFYLFSITLGLCFGIYYYKYLPSNEAELNDRAFRILSRLSQTINTRYDEVVNAIDNSIYDNPGCKRNKNFISLNSLDTGTLQQLHKNIQFYLDSNLKTVKDLDTFYHQGNLVYWPDTSKAAQLLDLAAFLKPILEKRCDVFGNYLLLYPKKSKNSDIAIPQIIFDQHSLANGELLNIDSATRNWKNRDEATLSDINISGKTYKLFLHPFSLHNHPLMLAGLLEKKSYDQQVRALPTKFLSNLVVFILLALICLPFVKIFLLSPKETISNKDAIVLSLSIFVGSGIVFLILYYVCIGYSVQANFDKRLGQVGRAITLDINHELNLASRQLDKFDCLYDSLRVNKHTDIQEALCYANLQQEALADIAFTPTIFKGVDRVFWIDSGGQTLAKWNPFHFNTQLASVANYPFFQRFTKTTGADSLTVYPGWSNTTGEFQVFIAKPSNSTILTYNGCDTAYRKSSGIALAAFLHCSNYPVLPPGFGFCVIDNQSGDVLIHSDNRHALSENLFEETGNNTRLRNCLQYKNNDAIDGISLYGKPSIFRIFPIGSQPLSLVTWYDKGMLYENLFRLVHFGAECLLYLYVLLGLCIFLSTYRHSKPPKLRFIIKPTEWIRPSMENDKAYKFTTLYFGLLVLLVLLTYFIVVLFHLDMRMLVYIAELAPFYGIWGFTASRRRAQPVIGNKWGRWLLQFSFVKLVWLNQIPFLTIFLANWIMIQLIAYPGFHHESNVVFAFFLFQAIVIAFLCLFHARCWNVIGRYNIKFSKAYLASLFLSMLLIGVLPVSAFITYGFQAEKIQYAKKKQLFLAGSIDRRTGYVNQQMIPFYKPAVLTAFSDYDRSGWSYLDSLKYLQGIYLTDHDTTWPVKTNGQSVDSLALLDEPYATLMDNLFLVTTATYHQYSIKDRSSDSSWRFYGTHTTAAAPALVLQFRNEWPDKRYHGTNIQTTMVKPWQSVSLYPTLLLWLMLAGVLVLLVAVWLLLRTTMNRLFLLDYFESKKWLCIDREWLNGFFAQSLVASPCYEERKDAQYPVYIGKEWRVSFSTIQEKEEFILAMTRLYTPVYEDIWAALSPEEQYFIYDFAKDNYSNYKDVETLVSLLNKRVLTYSQNRLWIFSRSFRNYILAKKGSDEINLLREQLAVPGVWETIRIPSLVVISVAAFFLVFTQEDFVHQAGALIASLTTFIPLVTKLAEKIGVVKGG